MPSVDYGANDGILNFAALRVHAIIARERIFHWERTRRSHERFSRQKWGRLWRCRKSVGCTTATNDGLPEKAKTHSCDALDLLGPSKFAPEPSPSRADIFHGGGDKKGRSCVHTDLFRVQSDPA